jgi:taurine dioxygenase
VSDAESRHLLELFFAHLTKPEHIVRHRWAAGDVAMWDNRSTAHYANRDYGDARRVMHRITLRGDAPVGVEVPDE